MPLMLLLAFYFALFTNVSQVDVCERIVFGSQGRFGLFLPKCNTGNGIREIIQRSGQDPFAEERVSLEGNRLG